MKTAVVVGANGDVGRGIVWALRGAGYRVAAVGRSMAKLDALRDDLNLPDLHLVEGSVASTTEAQRLAETLAKAGHRPSVIVISVNGQAQGLPLRELDGAYLDRVVRENVTPHLVAANTLIPLVAEGGTYIGIGGGMADNVFPGMAGISMAQAAQRVLYHYLAREPSFAAVNIRELILYSMIAGHGKAGIAESHWITAEEVGRHLVAILLDPETFAGPILALKSRKQVGLPERAPDR